MKKNYTPEEGCLYHAHSEEECNCDVDWTSREVYELREQRDRLQYQREFFQSAFIEQGDVLSKVIEQRDRLAEALRELCETSLKDKTRDITDLLNKAGDALAAVKG
jgi:hypothetical protein